jgi:triacylglycerol lipase
VGWRSGFGKVIVLAVVFALALPASAFASSAVVLVSGFDSHTPFTTPIASCATQVGPTWNSPAGTSATLRAAGEQVFTAPVANAGVPPGTPCTSPGGAVPPASDVIDSNGDVNVNGAALMHFLQFLDTNYGVTNVSLVGHSDGGLWSRSAITQMRAGSTGPVVQSLTTLGTPHTGSFGADLAEYVTDGKCELSNPTEQLLCQALLKVINQVFSDLGPTAVRELSSSFLASWNPQQTIGCPVSVAAGTFVKVPVIGWLLPDYYNPSDGIVGQASALAQASTSLEGTPIPAPGIPHVIDLGSFPVVHTADLSFLGTTNTLTNDPAIAMAVLGAVKAGTTRSPCASPGFGAPTPRPHRAVRLRRPFSAFGVGRGQGGSGSGSGRKLVAFLLRGGSIRCGRRPVKSVPLLGSQRVRVAAVRCRAGLRIRGRVLLLGRDPQRRVLVVSRQGRTLRVRVNGPRLRGLRERVRVRGSWRPLRRGVIRLPKGTRTVTVRAVGTDRSGLRLVATAVVAS